MAKPSPNLQHLTAGLPAHERADIEDAIASSPYLRQVMTEAVNAGTLKHIRMGVPGANEGGHYDGREHAIYISPDTFAPGAFDQNFKKIDAITSTLGHETGHALYAKKAEKELYFTRGSITDGIRAAGPDGEFDATGLVGAFIHDARTNEAQAEIHGWDALASRIEHLEGKPPYIKDMLKRADASTDCVDPLKNGVGYRLAPGIILDADLCMSDTRLPKAGPINLEPVAQCHFDQSGKSLGTGGGANYTNYYGAYLVQQLADDTKNWVNPPTIKMDMAKLGLDKVQLESTGLRLSNEGVSLIDTSRNGYRHVTLRSSGSGIQGTPDEQESALTSPSPSAPSAATLMTHPGHPAHAMYTQALGQIERGEMVPAGTMTQEAKSCLAAGTVAQFLTDDNRATRVDGLCRSKHDTGPGMPDSLIPVQGDPTTDYCRRASINVQQAMQTPLEQSSDTAQKAIQDRQQELAKELAQELAKEQARKEQETDGPVMRIGPRTMSPSQGPQNDGGGDGG